MPDREWEVRLQFLDETRDYLASIETELLGIGDRGLNATVLDRVLRAAHSIKGGAAMMGFQPLSDLAHQLEDGFKVLRARDRPTIDAQVEALLLAAIDAMAQVAAQHRQHHAIDPNWWQAAIAPTFASLEALLGKPSPQDEATVLSAESGYDMRVVMFETEVEACLQRLERVLAEGDSPVLREEFLIASQELGCLGEMLDLPAFVQLCGEIATAIETQAAAMPDVAAAALPLWRRSQDLVLIGQCDLLPSRFDLAPSPVTAISPPLAAIEATALARPEPEEAPENIEPPNAIEALAALDVLATLDAIAPDDTLADLLDLPDGAAMPEVEIAVAASNGADPSDGDTADRDTASSGSIPERAAEGTATIRIPLRHLQTLSDRFGTLNAERNSLHVQLQRLRELVELLGLRVQGLESANTRLRQTYDRVAVAAPTDVPAPISMAVGRGMAEVSSPFTTRFDLLEMDRYSEMHLLSREILDSVVQLQEVSSDMETTLREAEGTERELARATQQVQGAIVQVRLRLLQDVLSRFPRVLRDLSLKHGKPVKLVTRGGATLVERSVLEALESPLLHLIRNAFDHGIEDAATRSARGKPPEGTIEIAAVSRGNRITIAVSDDGGGIDLAKVRDRALQMGVSEADLDRASQAELLDLIFAPGFTTAAEVTDLSGRGVGMDVVRSNLQAIGGSVSVNTEPGQGTTFTLTVPVSLAITRVLLVESCDLLMAIPVGAVEEMLLLKDLTVRHAAAQETIDWEGYAVPLIRLRDRLQFHRPRPVAQSENRPSIDEAFVLIVARQNAPFALHFDRYWGEQEVTVRDLHSPYPLPPGFGGCAVLGGGRVVPVIDPDGLLAWAIATPALPALHLPPPASSRERRATIVVVDDSINVRRFLAATLEKAGYRVEQAKDGLEALEKLEGLADVKAVVCDIEMPRLDGFGFLAQARARDRGKHIPVVMLTSRSGSKHRDLALRLGASAYFTKPFKEQELLRALSHLTAVPVP